MPLSALSILKYGNCFFSAGRMAFTVTETVGKGADRLRNGICGSSDGSAARSKKAGDLSCKERICVVH